MNEERMTVQGLSTRGVLVKSSRGKEVSGVEKEKERAEKKTKSDGDARSLADPGGVSSLRLSDPLVGPLEWEERFRRNEGQRDMVGRREDETKLVAQKQSSSRDEGSNRTHFSLTPEAGIHAHKPVAGSLKLGDCVGDDLEGG